MAAAEAAVIGIIDVGCSPSGPTVLQARQARITKSFHLISYITALQRSYRSSAVESGTMGIMSHKASNRHMVNAKLPSLDFDIVSRERLRSFGYSCDIVVVRSVVCQRLE